ncbi:MAG: hypothetical protein ABIU95_08900, partial [Burkholderiales bacterium]
GETIDRATDRCLATKAKLTLPRGTFRHVIGVRDRVGRDPRGHALSVVVLAVVPADLMVDGMRPLRDTIHLAFDHDEMVSSAVAWLRGHLWSDRTLAAALVGPAALTTATFVGIQQAVQDDGQPVDVSNLRRRLVASGLFKSTTATKAGAGRGRPSAVWRWIV